MKHRIWFLIAGIIVIAVIVVGEVVRKSMAPDPIEESATVEAGELSPFAEGVKLRNERRRMATDADPNQEFNQADAITDAREEQLDETKKNVRVIRDAIKNN